MKHIKLFESFEKNEYYQELDFDTWADGASKHIDMNSIIIILLDKFFKEKWGSNVIKFGEYYTGSNRIRSYSAHKDTDDYVAIHEIPDEYLYVVISKDDIRKYYKCDQLDGVIKLLGDKL
jgi:hypothetical protein